MKCNRQNFKTSFQGKIDSNVGKSKESWGVLTSMSLFTLAKVQVIFLLIMFVKIHIGVLRPLCELS